MDACPTHEQLQHLLDELSKPAEQQALANHVNMCPACQARLQCLTEDHQLEHWRGLVGKDAKASAVTTLNSDTTTADIRFPEPPTPHGPRGKVASYHIVEELGAGGMAHVFKAYDEGLRSFVAVKVLKPELAAADRELARFENEARAARAIRSDHVVTIHHVGRTPGFPLPYFVMEYVVGETLAQRLKRDGALAATEAANLVREAALGLAAAHACRLVHRDIKPSNIMVEQASGRAKILDFGLVRALEVVEARFTPPGGLAGTPQYMSPEQILRPAQVDARSDIYSLGIVLYALLTGDAPFHGSTLSILQQVVQEEPRPPRRLNQHVPRDLETICLKALAKEPGRRYQSAQEFANDLERFLKGEPIQARPVGRTERLWRWCRRNPMIATLTGSAALLVMLVAVVASIGYVQTRAALDREALARQRATANEKRAVDVVNFLSRLCESDLNGQPDVQQLRRKLLETSLKYYREFLEEHADDPALTAYTALAYYRVAAITRDIGARQEAVAMARKGLPLVERLVADEPSNREYQSWLALACQLLAVLVAETGNHDEALALHQRAADIWRQLAQESDHPDHWRYFAENLQYQGELHYRHGRWQESLQRHDEALTLHKKLAVKNQEARFQHNLANAYRNFGATLVQLNQLDRAEANYREAVKILEALVRREPATLSYQKSQAITHNNLGVLHAQRLRLSEAAECYRKAREFYEKVLKLTLRDVDARYHLAAVHAGAGDLAYRTGQSAQAAGAYAAAIKLLEQLRTEKVATVEHRTELAKCYYRAAANLRGFKDFGPEKARDYCRKAIATLESLRGVHPDASVLDIELVRAYGAQGNVQRILKQPAESLTSLRKALALAEQLTRRNPEHPDYSFSLAICHNNLGVWHGVAGKDDKALEHFQKACAVREPLVRRHPENLDNQCGLGESRINAGLAQRNLKRLDQAEADLRQATRELQVPFEKAPAVGRHRPMLVRGYVHLAAVQELRGQKKEAAATFHAAARVLAKALPQFAKDANHPGADKLCADDAIAMLQQAIRCGFRDAESLKKGPEFDPLRSRADFQKLMSATSKRIP